MEKNGPFFETFIWSVAFFSILTAMVVLSTRYSSLFETGIKPVFVVISLIPFLIFLIVTDKLKGVSGAGFDLTFQESAQLAVSEGITDENIRVAQEPVGVKGESIPHSQRMTTLGYHLGESYHGWSDDSYFEHLRQHPNLRYILFNHVGGEFRGYMHVGEYENLLEYDVREFIDEVESEQILDRESVNTNSIQSGQTNQEALELMDDRNVSELAVVDGDGSFIGVANQSDIIRKYFASAM